MWSAAPRISCPRPRPRLYDAALMNSRATVARSRGRGTGRRGKRLPAAGVLKQQAARADGIQDGLQSASRHAPRHFDQRPVRQGHRDHFRHRPGLPEAASRQAFPLPHRPQHRRRLEPHPGEPVLRALDPHAALVRERHDPARRPDHHQRRSGDQFGRQGRKPRRHRARDRQLRRHHGHPPSARRRRAARRRIFADPGHQRRRRQP